LSYLFWLVVWNIFYFATYWEFHHPNWLSYFSEGLKPPTSVGDIINHVTSCIPAISLWNGWSYLTTHLPLFTVVFWSQVVFLSKHRCLSTSFMQIECTNKFIDIQFKIHVIPIVTCVHKFTMENEYWNVRPPR
jgi:hypothetical protein